MSKWIEQLIEMENNVNKGLLQDLEQILMIVNKWSKVITSIYCLCKEIVNLTGGHIIEKINKYVNHCADDFLKPFLIDIL